ncbi:MAG: ComEC/Rec2 family competence protein [Pseudomonadota bacterium]
MTPPPSRQAVALRRWAAAVIDGQRGHLFGWLPVAFGAGIGIYFALEDEPGLRAWVLLAIVLICTGVMTLRFGLRAPLLIAVFAGLAGFATAGARTHWVAAPVLGFPYYGPISGRIVVIDRSASDKIRLTLDRVTLDNVAPAETPARVRISLHGTQGFIDPRPGLVIALTGHLSPPRGATEPGGFDFQRHAWFDRLGAVGYTRTPVLALSDPQATSGRVVDRIRTHLSRSVQAAIPGQPGAFAAAVTTGDRSPMSLATIEDLRRANMAHLLAISGLHMGMLTGFVYAAIRYALALWPWVALRWPTHKIGAGAALLAGAAYLALSGGNVATERAFIMVSAFLIAVLLDQRALTLRSVAFAAMVVLIHRPEELMGPGFQMSFAATAALIAVFDRLRASPLSTSRVWVRWVAGVVISSAVAGLATAPFAAAHFNRVPHYGLIANTLSVPVMGAVVMPAAVLAVPLSALGLSDAALWVMAQGTRWILAVAAHVASWNGALSHVPAPGPFVLPLLALGGVWIILWQGRARMAGAVLVVAAGVVWANAQRPTLLISDTGGLVGWMTEEGRALSKARGEGFAAENWLAHDGDGASQDQAFARSESHATPDTAIFWQHETGRGAGERAVAACRDDAVIITSASVDAIADVQCQMFDKSSLARSGAVAIYVRGDETRIVPSRSATGTRPWQHPLQ